MVPIVIALGSAAVYGVADFCGGRAARQMSAVRVAAIGESISLVVVLAVVLGAGTAAPDAATWTDSAVGGVTSATGQTLLYWSLARGAMALVAPITAAVGVSVPVLIGLVSGDRPATAGYIGIAVGCAAVALVCRAIHEHTGRPTPISVIATAALAGVGFGVMFTLYHDLPSSSGLWPVVSARLAAVPLLWLVIGAARLRRTRSGDVIGQSAAHSQARPAWTHRQRRQPLVHAATAGQLDTAGTALYLVATRGSMLSVVAVVASLYPVATVGLALTIDRERISRHQQIGVILAGLALILVTLGGHRG